jgi:hypothetical protein
VIVRYAIQLCQGLAAAHDRGIVHRDLKPENVFATNTGQVKILDFGVAKLLQESHVIPQRGGDTGPGVVIGTIGYLSPEQIKGEAVDSRSDVFSLGIILYEMLTGRHPFRGANYVGTMHAILTASPAPASSGDDPMTAVLNRIVQRCLEKDRDRRFQSARDIFAIRGAQLVLVSPAAEGEDETTGEIDEARDGTVTYRDPPNWLVWSGPILLVLFVLGVLVTAWLVTGVSYVSGCVISSDGPTAILVVSAPARHQGDVRRIQGAELLKGYDFRQEVGHQLTVSHADAFGRFGWWTRNLDVLDFKRQAGSCGGVSREK